MMVGHQALHREGAMMSTDAKDFMHTLSTAGRCKTTKPPPIPGYRWVWIEATGGWQLEVSATRAGSAGGASND